MHCMACKRGTAAQSAAENAHTDSADEELGFLSSIWDVACNRVERTQIGRDIAQIDFADEVPGFVSESQRMACKRSKPAQSAGGSTKTNRTDEELDVMSGFTELV